MWQMAGGATGTASLRLVSTIIFKLQNVLVNCDAPMISEVDIETSNFDTLEKYL